VQGPAKAASTKLLNNPQFKTLTPLFKTASVVAKAFGLANTFNKVCAFHVVSATEQVATPLSVGQLWDLLESPVFLKQQS